MEKIITIKYGELSTKKDNRNFFIKILNNNIEKVLEDVEITYDFGRMFIIPKKDNFSLIVNKLQTIFGIHEILIAYKLEDKDLNNIKENLITLLKEKKFNTFKVEVKRSDKSYPLDSMALRKELGAYILKNIPNIKVDVNNPELLVNVEIRLKEVLIYFNGIKGLGGYPVSSLGKGILIPFL